MGVRHRSHSAPEARGPPSKPAAVLRVIENERRADEQARNDSSPARRVSRVSHDSSPLPKRHSPLAWAALTPEAEVLLDMGSFRLDATSAGGDAALEDERATSTTSTLCSPASRSPPRATLPAVPPAIASVAYFCRGAKRTHRPDLALASASGASASGARRT